MAMTDELLPVSGLVSQEELKARYGEASVRPEAVPGWGFNVVVDREWILDESVATELPQVQQVAQLAVLADRGGTTAIQVAGMLVPFEINFGDWLEWHAQQRGMQILQANVYPLSAPVRLDALVAHNHGGQQMMTRLTIKCQGAFTYLISGMALESEYKARAKQLGIAAVTFQPASGEAGGPLEPLFQTEDEAYGCQYAFPASWTANTVEPDAGEYPPLEFRLRPSGDQVIGYLRVQSTSVTRESAERAALLLQVSEQLEAMYGERGEWQQAQADSSVWMWWANLGAEDGASCCTVALKEFSAAELGSNTTVRGVIAVLVAPRREIAFWEWMRCKRALELILETVQPTAAPPV